MCAYTSHLSSRVSPKYRSHSLLTQFHPLPRIMCLYIIWGKCWHTQVELVWIRWSLGPARPRAELDETSEQMGWLDNTTWRKQSLNYLNYTTYRFSITLPPLIIYNHKPMQHFEYIWSHIQTRFIIHHVRPFDHSTDNYTNPLLQKIKTEGLAPL